MSVAHAAIKILQRQTADAPRPNNLYVRSQAQQGRRRISREGRPAACATRSDMAQVAIFLDAETTGPAPLQRLVVPEAARIQTDVAPHGAHVAQDRRGHRGSRLMQHTIVAADEFRVLDGGKRRERSDLYADSRHHVDALHIFNAANIHYKSRTEEPLLHGGDKIGAAG